MAKNNYMIVKSNKLINQSYKLNPTETKLIYYLITKMDREDEDFKVYSLKISDFLSMIGSANQQVFSIGNGLPKITGGLMQKGFSVVDEKGNLLQVNWLSSAYHRKKEGIIELEFSPRLKPYLLQLKEKFTIFNLSNVIKMKSSYSMRIYELLKQHEQFSQRIIAIDELKSILFLTESSAYKLYGNLKSRILEVAKTELAELSDIAFEYEEIKEGKKVIKLKFIITKNIPSIPIDLESNVQSPKLLTNTHKITRQPSQPKQLDNFKQRDYENYDFTVYYSNVKSTVEAR